MYILVFYFFRFDIPTSTAISLRRCIIVVDTAIMLLCKLSIRTNTVTNNYNISALQLPRAGQYFPNSIKKHSNNPMI